MRLSEVVLSELPNVQRLPIWSQSRRGSGKGIPTTVSASQNQKAAFKVQDVYVPYIACIYKLRYDRTEIGQPLRMSSPFARVYVMVWATGTS